MRKTRLVILPGARCLHQLGFLLLFLACPTIAFKGQENRDIQPYCRLLILKQNWLPNKPSEGIGCDENLNGSESGLWTLDYENGIFCGNNSTKETSETSSLNEQKKTETVQIFEDSGNIKSYGSRLSQRSGQRVTQDMSQSNRRVNLLTERKMAHSRLDSARRTRSDSRRESLRTSTIARTRYERFGNDKRRTADAPLDRRVESLRVMQRSDAGRTSITRVSSSEIDRRSVRLERRRSYTNPTVRNLARDTPERRVNVEERLARNNLNRASTRVFDLTREVDTVNLPLNRLNREATKNDQTPAERNQFRRRSQAFTRLERNNRLSVRSEIIRSTRRTDFLNDERRIPSSGTTRVRTNSPSRTLNNREESVLYNRNMNNPSQLWSRTDGVQERNSLDRQNRFDKFTLLAARRKESNPQQTRRISSVENDRRSERVNRRMESPQLARVSREIRENSLNDDSFVRVNLNERRRSLDSPQRFNVARLSERNSRFSVRKSSGDRRNMEADFERSSVDRESMVRVILRKTDARRSLPERNSMQRRILDSTNTLNRRISENRAQKRDTSFSRSMERNTENREAAERATNQLYRNRDSRQYEKHPGNRRILSQEVAASYLTRTNSAERRFGSDRMYFASSNFGEGIRETSLRRLEVRDSKASRVNYLSSLQRNNRIDARSERIHVGEMLSRRNTGDNVGRSTSSPNPTRRISVGRFESEPRFMKNRRVTRATRSGDERSQLYSRLRPEHFIHSYRSSDPNEVHRSLRRNANLNILTERRKSDGDLNSYRASYVRSRRVMSVDPMKDIRSTRYDANKKHLVRSSEDERRIVSGYTGQKQQFRNGNSESRRYSENPGEKISFKENSPSRNRFFSQEGLQDYLNFVRAKAMTTDELFGKSQNNEESLRKAEGFTENYNLSGTIAGGIICATLFLNVQKRVY